MVEWKRIEFLFILACIYAPAMLLIAGVVASEATASLAVVWAVLVIALAVLLCNIYKELDNVWHVVMDAVGVSIARRLTLSLMLRLRGRARDYRRIEKEIDRLLEEKQVCKALRRIRNDVDCKSIDERIKQLEERQELIAEKIRDAIYNYFSMRIKRGG